MSFFLLFTFVNLSGSILDDIKGLKRIDIEPCRQQSTLLTPSKEINREHLAGYVAAVNLENPVKESVTSVSASWTIPALESAGTVWIWTGIDGYQGIFPERLGTVHTLQGEQRDRVWIQLLPGLKLFVTNIPLNPNDHVAAEVNYVGDGEYNLIFINYTQNVYFDYFPREKNTIARRETAEWMVESSEDSMLPNFGTISFSQCSRTIDSITAPINNSAYEALNMKYRVWGTEAITSALSLAGKSFDVTWVHY